MSGCILFDLDGTLVDSAPDLAASANYLCERFDLRPLPYGAMRESAGKGARGMLWASLRVGPEAACFDKLKEEFLTNYEAHISEHSTLFDGVSDMIREIESSGLDWGIVTNKSGHLARKLCQIKGILPANGCVVSGSDLGAMKPRPDPVLEGMRITGHTPADTVYVGDDARDAASAAAAGVAFLAARWGYVGSGPDISRWGASRIAHHPGDIVRLALEVMGSRT